MELLVSRILKQVITIAQQAGDYVLSRYNKQLDVQLKADKTPVTDVDVYVNDFLIKQLNLLTPGIPILSEESSYIELNERSSWEYYWLIDPLDGTEQFIQRTDQFAVMLALMQNNRPILGVIHLPIPNITYYATLNQGAYKVLDNKIIVLSNANKMIMPNKVDIVVGPYAKQEKVLEHLNQKYTYNLDRIGSSGVKSCLIAEGAYDAYVSVKPTGEWDSGAADIIVTESGGKLVDLAGKPLTYNQRNTLVNPSFILLGNKKANDVLIK